MRDALAILRLPPQLRLLLQGLLRDTAQLGLLPFRGRGLEKYSQVEVTSPAISASAAEPAAAKAALLRRIIFRRR